MYPAPAAQPPHLQSYKGYAVAAATAAQYAAPAPTPLPGGYGQPQYQQAAAAAYYGQPPHPQQQLPAPSQNGPPYKKQKGNPVITRYAPPLGYPTAPSHPPAQFGATHYAAAPEYQPQPAHPQTAYHQGYQPPPVAAYPPAATYPPQPSYDPNQAYQQPPYQPPQPAPVYQPYAVPAPTCPPQDVGSYYDSNGTWVSTAAFSPASGQASVPHTEVPIYAAPMSDDGYAPSHTRQSSVDYGLDLDFESEVGVGVEDLSPDLSLGLIIWHPAEPTKVPLPSSFAEAEPEWMASSKAADGKHDPCASKYFADGKAHQATLSVRQSDEWEEVRDDLIFVEFDKRSETVPILAVIANRDRPDLAREQLEPVAGRPAREVLLMSNQAVGGAQENNTQPEEDQSDGDQAMDMSDDDEDEPVKLVAQPILRPTFRPELQAPPTLQKVNIVKSLERVVSPKEYWKNDRQPQRIPARHSRSRSPEKRSRSPTKRSRSPEKRSRQGSQQPGHIPKAKPAQHPKDAAQENILAALGVEGSPKMVYPTPPPALGPPVPPGNRNKSTMPGAFGPPSNGTYQPFHYGPILPPPPPPRESRSPSYDPWRAHDAATTRNRGGDSPRSVASQQTLPGSDFHPDNEDYDMDATPKTKAQVEPDLERTDSGRKRTFDEATANEGRRRQDEDTPRARRRQSARSDVYSRYRR